MDFAISPPPRRPASLAGRPNVLVFFTDQQRYDTTGLHGCPLNLTPNFDAFARANTHLATCVTPSPVCGPARAVMQTGQYHSRSGCFRNGLPLPEGTPTLAGQFRAAGYRTGYVGKWHLAGHGNRSGPVPPERRGGYEEWLAAELLEFTSDAYSTTLYDEEDRPVFLPGYRVDACVDAGIRFVDRHREAPFLLFVSLLEPHHQNYVDDYPAPDGYRDRYAGRWTPPDLAALRGSSARHLGGYFGMVKRIDEAFGRTLDALKSLGLLDDTLVLFTSDHGNHFKTRNREYKRTGHEASVRVPGAIGGGPFRGGGRIDRPVSLVDVVPTLLEAAGLTIPPSVQGRPIGPLVRREPSADDWPDDALIQICDEQVGRALRTGRWKYVVHAPDADPKRQGGSARYVEAELYDLDHDAHELDNLITNQATPALKTRLRERLIAAMVRAGEPQPTIDGVPAADGWGRHYTAADAEA